MKRLRSILETLLEGKKVRGLQLSLYDIEMLIMIYNELITDRQSEFINSKCKELLNKCNINTKEKGIGWVATI